ncbi:MAG: cardiolipin synthase [Spirochaetaceae bacterium]
MELFPLPTTGFWPLITAFAGISVSILASSHAILYKRDSRAVVGWVGVIWLVPVFGAFLYVLFGINRVNRRVAGKRGDESAHISALDDFHCSPSELLSMLPGNRKHLLDMYRLGESVTGLYLLKRNTVHPLVDGDEAYPAMLEAIENARESISMATYIFDNDPVGRRFLDALARAVDRGVEVRVLIDAVGARYSMPPMRALLSRHGVPTAYFMPRLFLWRTPYLNLRNHRKILIADGRVGFTGGMNIRKGHLLSESPAHPIRDVHFRLAGPVVHQLQATFVEDWQFATGELLSGDRWFPVPEATGGRVAARAIPDGPDQDMDKTSMTFQGALASARHSVRIVTPYFLPERPLIAALNTCVLRGVSVDIVLPEHNNLRMVAWAAMAQMWQVLEWGCRVWLTAGPFDHTKLMVVDGALSLIGSPNWDSRSLRLNFELGVECYDADLALRIGALIDERMARARALTSEEVNGRPLPIKLRDGFVRLAAPYL